jgi:hypothetical protein
VYPLGAFQPGDSLDLAAHWSRRQSLESFLKGRRTEQDERQQHRLVVTPYNAAGFDVPRNLQQMMFYTASGGQEYARLLNRYQNFVDLSGHLKLNRALLVGYVQRPFTSGARTGAELRRTYDGGQTWETIEGPQDKRWTCYRFVIPVVKEDGK